VRAAHTRAEHFSAQKTMHILADTLKKM